MLPKNHKNNRHRLHVTVFGSTELGSAQRVNDLFGFILLVFVPISQDQQKHLRVVPEVEERWFDYPSWVPEVSHRN